MRGQLRQRGDAWELRALAGRDPATGRKKYVTLTFHGSKRAAESELSKLVAEASRGGLSAQDTTLEELLSRWSRPSRSCRSRRRATTVASFAATSCRPSDRSRWLASAPRSWTPSTVGYVRAAERRAGRWLQRA